MRRPFYHAFRKTKEYLIKNKPPIITNAFFRMCKIAESMLSETSSVEDAAWKSRYFTKYSMPQFKIITNHPVAEYSDDHKAPRGSINDNSVNKRFNKKLYDFIKKPEISLLDLGCAGGGFVKSIIEDGHTAIGIEGSNACKKRGYGEWNNCPYHLFTADITQPFRITNASGKQITFDAITAWEVLEHIPENKLNNLLLNIARHAHQETTLIVSVATTKDENPIEGTIYHHTIKPKAWWLQKFSEHGFIEIKNHPFKTPDYIRGNGIGWKNWDPADGDGFHLVMKASKKHR
ncbi:methyltransferase domain-containing protein [Candidatus Woesearchaeota archaeon]|nr:methyltransferase domain-containing protein [Candidatus Woesearchaeota archaeon]